MASLLQALNLAGRLRPARGTSTRETRAGPNRQAAPCPPRRRACRQVGPPPISASAERDAARSGRFRLPAARKGVAASQSQEAAVSIEGGPDVFEGTILSEYNTWAIGGPARYFTTVTTEDEMAAVLRYCAREGLQYFVLGKGSNCLFDDRGFDGVVVLNQIEVFEDLGDGVFRAGAGYAFNQMGAMTSRDGWSGLEFAIGIPGTVGGAVFMNAGANGQETGEVVTSVEMVDTEGNKRVLTGDELVWSYRHSPFMDMEGRGVVTAATFQLAPNEEARGRALEYMDKRRQSQPVTSRTCGCVWRNPPGASAGMLIDELGLKGAQVGEAEVSEMHANFLINKGGSTAADILELIQNVKAKVEASSGHELEEEVRFVPFDYQGKCTDFRGMLERHRGGS